MRRLVAISNKTSKALAALAATIILLTSIHMAASARISALRQQQDKLERATISNQQLALSQNAVFERAGAMQAQASSTMPVPEATKTSPVPAAAPVHKRQIVISIADRKLAVVEDGHVLKTYPIAVGARHTPSPDGDFVIVNRAKEPTYRHGDKEIPPGKDNPLGSRWMGLNAKGYGIHGTNVPNSIGKAASHGCFRMRKEDVEELYTLVQVGDAVAVRRERDAMVAQVFATPAAPADALTARTQSSGEVQMASATVTTIETTEQ